MKKINCVLLGFILLFLDMPAVFVREYPIGHVRYQAISRGIAVEAIRFITGRNMRIDIFPDILGYALVFAGLFMLRNIHKRFKSAMPAVFAGMISNIILIFIPFAKLEIYDIIKISAVFKCIELLSYAVLLFYVGRGIYALTDNYMHMELWKELKFSWDIVVITPLFIYFMRFLAIFDIPAAEIIAVLLYGIYLYANMYYIYVLYSYCKKLIGTEINIE